MLTSLHRATQFIITIHNTNAVKKKYTATVLLTSQSAIEVSQLLFSLHLSSIASQAKTPPS